MNPFKKTVLYNMCKTLLFYSVDSNTGPTKDRKWLWTPPVTPAAGVQAPSVFMLAWFFPLSLFPLTVFSSECRANTQAPSGCNKSQVSGGWPLTSDLVDRSFSTDCIFASAWGSEFPLRLLLVHECGLRSVVQEWSLKPEGHHGNCILKRRYLTLYLCVINANDGSKNQFETALNSKLQINLVTLRKRSEVKQDMMF